MLDGRTNIGGAIMLLLFAIAIMFPLALWKLIDIVSWIF